MCIIINNIDIIIYRNVHNYSFEAFCFDFLSNRKNKMLLWFQTNCACLARMTDITDIHKSH